MNLAKHSNLENETQLPFNSRREILTAVYRCDRCDKAFSAENYLNSHIKRRHNNGENVISNEDNDDKLQSEIKELKERLNSTDKLLQEIHASESPVYKKVTDSNQLSDLEHKFCSFREQIENEIATLHFEKNMYEEKYTKLFDLILQSKEKANIIMESQATMTENIFTSNTKEVPKSDPQPKNISVENCTQTEDVMVKSLNGETEHRLLIDNSEDSRSNIKSTTSDTDKKIENAQKKLSEDIENKVQIICYY